VFVPLYIIIGGFTPAQSVALSNITILGGAVANFIANSTKRHAFRDAPLIDWDLIMVMEPTTMLGALLGSYTNKVGAASKQATLEQQPSKQFQGCCQAQAPAAAASSSTLVCFNTQQYASIAAHVHHTMDSCNYRGRLLCVEVQYRAACSGAVCSTSLQHLPMASRGAQDCQQ
jgi:hypothetical protein